jgi:hypothetical protein
MGIFDIFGTGDQQAAAQSQIQGLEQGYNLGTGYTNQAIGSLNTGAGDANTALSTGYGAATNAINAGYGAGSSLLGTNYAASLAPYMQNYSQAQGGVNQLGNVLGLNGPAGSDAALKTLQNTPGYQFEQQQGDASINAAAAANGTLNSGNQMLALSNYNQGLAGTTYNNYVNQLQPFLGASNAAAGGVASGYQGLGQGLAGISTGGANAQAGLATGLAGGQAGIATGLGSATAAQQDQQAQMGWGLGTGTGNANANADLSGLNASGNFWNLLGGLGGMKTSGGGTVGGNAVSGIGSSISSALPGIMAMFSDERLKENIEPVGSLYDATNVYRYNYKGDPTPRIGLIAQEVEKTRPDAVIEIGGYKAVDYGKATQYASELSHFLKAA